MTYILVGIKTMAGDPGYVYQVQDMDLTGGSIQVTSGNNDIELRSRILDNDQARTIRKAIEAGLTGSELEDVILAARGPDRSPAPEPAPAGIQNDHALDAANAPTGDGNT